MARGELGGQSGGWRGGGKDDEVWLVTFFVLFVNNHRQRGTKQHSNSTGFCQRYLHLFYFILSLFTVDFIFTDLNLSQCSFVDMQLSSRQAQILKQLQNNMDKDINSDDPD